MAAPLTGALHRCLAKEPTDRWPSADTFVGALEQGLTQEDATPTLTDAGPVPVNPPASPPAPAPRRSAAVALGVAAVAAAALILLGGPGAVVDDAGLDTGHASGHRGGGP